MMPNSLIELYDLAISHTRIRWSSTGISFENDSGKYIKVLAGEINALHAHLHTILVKALELGNDDKNPDYGEPSVKFLCAALDHIENPGLYIPKYDAYIRDVRGLEFDEATKEYWLWGKAYRVRYARKDISLEVGGIENYGGFAVKKDWLDHCFPNASVHLAHLELPTVTT